MIALHPLIGGLYPSWSVAFTALSHADSSEASFLPGQTVSVGNVRNGTSSGLTIAGVPRISVGSLSVNPLRCTSSKVMKAILA